MKNLSLNWQKTLASLASTQDHEISCSEIPDDVFAHYAEMDLAGQDPGEQYPLIRQHLTQCDECRHDLEDIVEMLRFEAQHAESLTTDVVDFDLSFLPSASPVAVLPQMVAAAFATGRKWVRDEQAAIWLNLSMIVDSFSRETPAMAVKGGLESEADIVFRYAIAGEDSDDLDLDVVGTAEEAEGFCTLSVRAIVPSKWPQLAGIEVLMIGSTTESSASTDEQGYVRFEKVPIAELHDIAIRAVC